jgi:dynein light chain 1
MRQEPVGDTLEELWMSYNGIEKLKGCAVLRKLKVGERSVCVCFVFCVRFSNNKSSWPQVFYLSNNKVKDWKEFDELKLMDSLEDLLMVGNPLQVANDADGAFLKEVTARLPKLKKLDGIPIVRAE